MLIREDANVVAQAISEWCLERAHPPSGANTYHNDIEHFFPGLDQPFGPGNPVSAKVFSHYNRLNTFTEAYLQDPTNDFQTARVVFNALTQLSTARSSQQWVRSEGSQDKYNEIMTKRHPLGIVIGRNVLKRIVHLQNQPTTTESVFEQTKQAFELSLDRLKLFIQLGKKHPGDAALLARANQSAWLNVVVDHIDLFAKERGSLEQVPFLEPRSISEQNASNVHYPFKSDIPPVHLT